MTGVFDFDAMLTRLLTLLCDCVVKTNVNDVHSFVRYGHVMNFDCLQCVMFNTELDLESFREFIMLC